MSTQLERTIRRSDGDGVAVLELDRPDRSMNVVGGRLLADLAGELDDAWADEAVTAIVLGSAKATFGAGADVSWLPEPADETGASEVVSRCGALGDAAAPAAVPRLTKEPQS
ncbi:enoyl-CoA hydratase/isomerase family protein [Actinomadura sp. 1N219]|uniref:enoyl-CoA hydratase/isomerase family protein n=1 Tax=Actinomadura sp. 1N219 TaxID=3375152 RepID=UPI0037B9AF6F